MNIADKGLIFTDMVLYSSTLHFEFLAIYFTLSMKMPFDLLEASLSFAQNALFLSNVVTQCLHNKNKETYNKNLEKM